MLTVKISKDEVTPDLRRLLREAAPGGPLYKVMGRAGANALRKHFRARNSQGNKLGGKRTNFWSRVAQSVNSPKTAAGKIVVPVNHNAMAQKVFGGTIRPTNRKALAFAIHPAGYGLSPRDFDDVVRGTSRAGNPILGRPDGAGEIEWLWVVVAKVTQKKDPKALPPKIVVVRAVTKGAQSYLKRRRG